MASDRFRKQSRDNIQQSWIVTLRDPGYRRPVSVSDISMCWTFVTFAIASLLLHVKSSVMWYTLRWSYSIQISEDISRVSRENSVCISMRVNVRVALLIACRLSVKTSHRFLCWLWLWITNAKRFAVWVDLEIGAQRCIILYFFRWKIGLLIWLIQKKTFIVTLLSTLAPYVYHRVESIPKRFVGLSNWYLLINIIRKHSVCENLGQRVCYISQCWTGINDNKILSLKPLALYLANWWTTSHIKRK